MIDKLKVRYPVSGLCKLLGLASSTYYYKPHASEDEVEKVLLEVAGQWPTYGSRRLKAQLDRRGFVISREKVRSLMKKLGIMPQRVKRKKRTTNSQHGFQRYPNLVKGLDICRPDQVWVADITYIRLNGRFIYRAIVMDVFTRQIRGWHVSDRIDHHLTKQALLMALETGRPEIHHTDQGVQYATPKYAKWLEGVQISMAEVGKAWQNGYAERVIRTIKEDEVALSDYRSLREARGHLHTFLTDTYPRRRIHSSLGYLTPAEFEARWWHTKHINLN